MKLLESPKSTILNDLSAGVVPHLTTFCKCFKDRNKLVVVFVSEKMILLPKDVVGRQINIPQVG